MHANNKTRRGKGVKSNLSTRAGTQLGRGHLINIEGGAAVTRWDHSKKGKQEGKRWTGSKGSLMPNKHLWSWDCHFFKYISYNYIIFSPIWIGKVCLTPSIIRSNFSWICLFSLKRGKKTSNYYSSSQSEWGRTCRKLLSSLAKSFLLSTTQQHISALKCVLLLYVGQMFACLSESGLWLCDNVCLSKTFFLFQ